MNSWSCWNKLRPDILSKSSSPPRRFQGSVWIKEMMTWNLGGWWDSLCAYRRQIFRIFAVFWMSVSWISIDFHFFLSKFLWGCNWDDLMFNCDLWTFDHCQQERVCWSLYGHMIPGVNKWNLINANVNQDCLNNNCIINVWTLAIEGIHIQISRVWFALNEWRRWRGM